MRISERKLKNIIRESINQLLLESDSRLNVVNKIIEDEFSGLLSLDSVVRSNEYYVNGNPQTTWRQYLLFSLRHTFGLMANSDVKYLPLVAKLAFGNEVKFEKVNDNNIEVGLLQKIVMILKKQPEVFQELNARRDTITFSQVYELLKPQIDEMEQADSASANQIQERNDYDIVEVPDFKTANYYGNHSCSQSKLCYTQSERTWNDYKGNKGQNRVYVCLKHGWENIPERPSEGNPYDEYGTSMIFVFINPDGDISTSNCRWNHETVGEYDGSVDHAFSKTTLAETVGRNFDATFKPYSREQLRQMGIIKFEEVPELLAQGVDPKDIFDFISKDIELTRVGLNNKWNFITDNNQLLLPEQWFNRVSEFQEGFARVGIINNGQYRYNFINTNGEYLWKKPVEQWFDLTGDFDNGFAKVELNKKWNYINTDGVLLWDKPLEEWFDSVSVFENGFCVVGVRINGDYRWNYLNTSGKLISPNYWFLNVWHFESNGFAKVGIYNNPGYSENIINTNGEPIFKQRFDWVSNFDNNGLACVALDSKYNFINANGQYLWNKPEEEWFDDVSYFSDGLAKVGINDKYNYIKTNGELLWNKPPEEWFNFFDNFYNGFLRVGINGKYNFININGELLWEKPLEEWFSFAWNFNDDGYAEVKYGQYYRYLRDDGFLCDYDTKKPIPELNENKQVKLSKTILNEKRNIMDKTKKAFFTEEQMKYIKNKITENVNYVDPNKVLLVKKYLDDNFVRGNMPIIGEDGYPTDVKLVGMKGSDGQVIQNKTAKQLFYQLQDKFKGIYGDKTKRNKFLIQVLKDWYNKKITKDGLLSKNIY